MSIIKNYNYILNFIQSISKETKLIVVTKNQKIDNINLLINLNHFHFGENRVQEASLKWKNLIYNNSDLKLHLIGKLQSNKAKEAFEIFHYIHTLDNEKLAKIFSKLEENSPKKIKYFIQVNVGNEPQKSGIAVDKVDQFIKYCKNDLKLNIIGLMCLPPINEDAQKYFKELRQVAFDNNLKELSMGMSKDYISAIKNGSTFVRVGSSIFEDKFN
jgi:pyridoxal phosphate enzyme (YggS family)